MKKSWANSSLNVAFEYLLDCLLLLIFQCRQGFYQLFPSNVEASVKNNFQAIGITINGTQPWDIQVHDPKFYTNVALNVSLGLGEGYMDKLWSVPDLNALFARIFKTTSKKSKNTKFTSKIYYYFKNIRNQLMNLQNRKKAWEVGEKHYDIGNDLFEAMLDTNMNYSCGYWTSSARSLEEAQIAKMDLIALKLKLSPGMKVLDIGCGWGSLPKYFAQKYGVTVVGITISKEQLELAEKRCQGLPIEIELMDYRDLPQRFLPGEFDRIVSVGMFEHVGFKNYNEYFQVCQHCLKDNGLFLYTSHDWVEQPKGPGRGFIYDEVHFPRWCRPTTYAYG